MIYISHLIPDEKMKFFVEKYGVGVESIDFSISDNLDQLSRSIEYCREKLKYMGTDQLILHGPFLDVNPCAYDSLVREATMTRFSQCYEAGLELGTKKAGQIMCLFSGRNLWRIGGKSRLFWKMCLITTGNCFWMFTSG